MNASVSFDQAQQLVLNAVSALPAEHAELLSALGRVCAAPLSSDIDVCNFAYSAMDGFALHAADTATACADNPAELKVVGHIGAGSVYTGPLGVGECVRIMTGAAVPPEADAVQKHEVVRIVQGDGGIGSVVAFAEPVAAGRFIHQAGEEVRSGQVIAAVGQVLSPLGAGMLTSCGVQEVFVHRRPRVAVAATGSELVDPREFPPAGKIRNSNATLLAALVQAAGGMPVMLPAIPDDPDCLRAAVRQATASCDFVITSGGANNGDFDFISRVVEGAGGCAFTEVRMRPGRMQTFGTVDGTPVYGLPGTPMAVLLCFLLLIAPALRKMQGLPAAAPRVRAAVSGIRCRAADDPQFFHCQLQRTGDELAGEHRRSTLEALLGSDNLAQGIAMVPAGCALQGEAAKLDCLLVDAGAPGLFL